MDRDGEIDSKVKVFGQHIVADPRICHGQLTFRGTRILVAVVLAQVARGMDWDEIVSEWRGNVPREAIANAVMLAGNALQVSSEESRLDTLTLERRAG